MNLKNYKNIIKILNMQNNFQKHPSINGNNLKLQQLNNFQRIYPNMLHKIETQANGQFDIIILQI